jgi:GMP synthase-like glutamine amidotransferase
MKYHKAAGKSHAFCRRQRSCCLKKAPQATFFQCASAMHVIGILECGQTRSDWLAEHGEIADPFPPFLTRADPTLTFRVYKAHKDELPRHADECDAWLVTGSPNSVYERPAWQARLSAFLVEVAKHRPVIGICYGHQLLHDALGGAVERAAAGWGIGVQKYELREVPAWAPPEGSRGATDGFHLIALHQDQVTRPAPGSRVLAGNTFCPSCITTIGENVFTIQAHPEMTRQLAKALYEELRTEQGSHSTDVALQSLDTKIDGELAARWILAFVQYRLRR